MRFLTKLERWFGWLTVGHLPIYIVSAQALVAIFTMINPDIVGRLYMDPEAVRAGEYWRLATFLFLSPFESPIWTFFYLYFQYICGVALEEEWGSFPFTMFYLLGVVSAIAAAFLAGGEMRSAFYLNESIFLAFAAMYPNFQILFFFILPIRMKWVALLTWLQIVIDLARSSNLYRAAIVLSLLNYVAFFSSTHWRQARELVARYRHRRRYRDFDR